MPLPKLREELDLLNGTQQADGQPTWTLHDPVRNLFFRIDWPTLEILQRWDLDDPSLIAAEISNTSTLKLEAEDVEDVAKFLMQHHLVQVSSPENSQKLSALFHKLEGTKLNWLLHHYLFFRIPLIKPDAWLTKWVHVAKWFASTQFKWLTAFAFLFGISQVIRRWDVFSASLVDTFNLEGLIAYGVAIFFVKLLHELGHAFTAKQFGCRVPTMGLAFLVMWPVAYTDTNETWRLTDRIQRLKVASAGIATELVIAVWCTLAWAILPNGNLQSAAFVLATTSWVATLAINASPFMRFDGYFILMDALDLPNLHGRSFALARWKLREFLFGLGDEPPESFEKTKQLSLIIFAWATWIYRLVLFLGIALLVYHFFFKLLGIFLFCVEIIWFIAKPLNSELSAWKQLWPRIRRQRRSQRTAVLAGICLILFALPWPGRISGSGVLRPVDVYPIYAPAGARIDALPIQHGSQVSMGQAVIELYVPELNSRQKALQLRLDQQRFLASTALFDEAMRRNWQVAEQSLNVTEAELEGVRAEQKQFIPVAPFEGLFLIAQPDMTVGQWVSKKEQLALIVSKTTTWRVETWIDEEDVARLELGQSASFISDSATGSMLKLSLAAIDKDASRVLPRKELSSALGGHILTREKNGQLTPERSVYRVIFNVEKIPEDMIFQTWRGQVVVHANWQIPIEKYIRHAASVFFREAGF